MSTPYRMRQESLVMPIGQKVFTERCPYSVHVPTIHDLCIMQARTSSPIMSLRMGNDQLRAKTDELRKRIQVPGYFRDRLKLHFFNVLLSLPLLQCL